MMRLLLFLFFIHTVASLHAERIPPLRGKITFYRFIDVSQFYSTSFGFGVSMLRDNSRIERDDFGKPNGVMEVHHRWALVFDYAPFVSTPACDVRLLVWQVLNEYKDRHKHKPKVAIGLNLLVAGNFYRFCPGLRPEIGIMFKAPQIWRIWNRDVQPTLAKLVYGYSLLFGNGSATLPFRGHAVSFVYYL